MDSDERRAFVQSMVATTGARGAALDAIVDAIVSEWDDDVRAITSRAEWVAQGGSYGEVKSEEIK